MDICKVILFDIATIFRPKIMQWTKEHDDLLVKEVLALDPFSSPKGSTERSNVWDSIAGHLILVAMSSLLYLEDQSRTGFNLCS